MQIIQKKTAALKGYDRNARTHSDEQVGQIAASIREFGFNNPILVDEADTVIAGHGRLAAALLMGLDTVPVIVLGHLTETQRRAYVLADNKIALNAGWDQRLLSMEVVELLDAGVELSLLGFDNADLPRLLSLFDEEIPVLDSVGGMDGGNYGDARSSRIPVNILGIGGMVDRELMGQVKARLLAAGASLGEDNGELLASIYRQWVSE